MFGGWKLDKNSQIPLYLQISKIIKDAIDDGIIHAGGKLPSQRQLAEVFKVSRNTVLACLDNLLNEGVITIKPQSGAIVREKPTDGSKIDKSPDWNKYFKNAMHRYGAVERIDQLTVMARSREKVINISAAGLGSEFNLLAPVINLLEQKVLKKDFTRLNHFNKYGYPPLCRTIAERMKKFGIHVTEKQVLIVPSVLQGINLNCLSFLHFGSNFVYEKPNVINMDSIVHYTGSNMVAVPTDDEGIMPDKLASVLKTKNSFLYLNPTSQNPTGKTMSLQRRKDVLDIACKRRVPILEVDSLRDIDIDGKFPPPLRALDTCNSVIYHGSILRTLTFNLGISWIIAAEDVIEQLSDVKAQSDIYPSIILQLIADELLQDNHYDDYLDTIRPILARKRVQTFGLLQKYFKDIASWKEEDCEFYVWLKFNEGINTKKLFETVRSVEFYPGFFFDKTDTSHISICPASVPYDDLDEGLFRLNQSIRKL